METSKSKTMYEIYTYIEHLGDGDENFKKIQELRKAEYDNEFKSGSVSFEMNGTYDEETIVAYDTLEEVLDFWGDDTSSLSVCFSTAGGEAVWTDEELLQIMELFEEELTEVSRNTLNEYFEYTR